jgi:MscS family membrane protein
MSVTALIYSLLTQASNATTDSAPASQGQASEAGNGGANGLDDMGAQIATWFGPTFEKTTWIGWLILLGGIFLGLAAGKIVQTCLRAMANRIQKREWRVRAAIVRHIAGPANLALITCGLSVGMSGPHKSTEVAAFVEKVIGFLYIIAIAWFLYNVIELLDFALRRIAMKSHTKLDDAVVILLRRALRIFLLIMMTLFVAENIFNANVTAWLAGLGIAGLAVSLAAQDSIKNLFGSVTILMEHPFGVGDRIIFENIDGFVEDIGFRSTKIRNFNGHLLTVPNMKFTDGVIENISARPWARRTMNITITYDTPPEKVDQAVKIVKDILAEPDIVGDLQVPDRPPRVFFSEFNADSLNIAVTYFYLLNVEGRDWWTFQAHAERINQKVLRAFADAGIEFAFPTRTVFLAGDPARELSVRVLSNDERPSQE